MKDEVAFIPFLSSKRERLLNILMAVKCGFWRHMSAQVNHFFALRKEEEDSPEKSSSLLHAKNRDDFIFS